MGVTVEIDGSGIRFVDTAGGRPVWGPSLVKSITAAEKVIGGGTLATAGTLTVPFGNVAAGKVLCIKVSAGPVTVSATVNSVALGDCRVNDLFLLVDTGGGITACTVTQSTGSDVTVETFVAGST